MRCKCQARYISPNGRHILGDTNSSASLSHRYRGVPGDISYVEPKLKGKFSSLLHVSSIQKICVNDVWQVVPRLNMLRYVVYLIEEQHVHGYKTDLCWAIESKKAILLRVCTEKQTKLMQARFPYRGWVRPRRIESGILTHLPMSMHSWPPFSAVRG